MSRMSISRSNSSSINDARTPGRLTKVINSGSIDPNGIRGTARIKSIKFKNPPYNCKKQIVTSNKNYRQALKLKENIDDMEKQVKEFYNSKTNKKKETREKLVKDLLEKEKPIKQQILKYWQNVHHPYNLGTMCLGNIYMDCYEMHNMLIDSLPIFIGDQELVTVKEYDELNNFIDNVDNVKRILLILQ